MASWRYPFDDPHAEASRGDDSEPHARSLANADPRFEHSWAFQTSTNQQDPQYQTPSPSHQFHPVIDASLGPNRSSISSDATVGRFIHSQCDQELFNAEYLRSNKASGHKNLRCFPHCCGGHNPKSFCGSGLVVECALPNAQVAIGRFEEVVKSPHGSTANANATGPEDGPVPNKPTNAQHAAELTNQLHHDVDAAPTILPDASPDAYLNSYDRIIIPGRAYSRRELFRELKSPDNPFGMWFKGTPVAASSSATPRFHLNGNRASWHYGWQSSRLNCKNLHVFRVYFFSAPSEDSDTLTCVASVGSPSFRISSSRKARKTFRSSPSMQSLADSVSGDDQVSIPQSSPRGAMGVAGAAGDDDRLSVDSFDGAATAASASTTPTTASTTSTLPTLRSRSSFDLGLGFGGFAPAAGSGDMLPSLSSRLSRASTTTAMEPFGVGARHYGAEPDRKRLTRSASLQSDYYSSHVSSLATREPRSRTFPMDETSHTQSYPSVAMASPPATHTPARSRGGMMSMDSLLNSSPSFPAANAQQSGFVFPAEPAFRPSLTTIAVPPLTLSHFHHQPPRGHPLVTTPVSDMMQLQLSTPRVLPRSVSTSSAVSSSSDFLTPTGTPHRARRKRTRSADSPGRSGDNQHTSSWHDGPLMDEIAPHGDWDLVAQAHALGVVVAIASRLRPVNHGDRTSYQIVWKQSTSGHAATAPISRETQPALARLCDVLLAVAPQLIHRDSLLVAVRAKMQELIHGRSASDPSQDPVHHDEGRCKHLITLYEEMLAFVLPRVEEQVASAVSQQPEIPHGAVSSPSPLVDLIRAAEHEIAGERWWRDVALFDDDDDDYPFMDFVKGYYDAVCASAAHVPLPLPSPDVAVGGARLSGEWRLLQSSLDEIDLTTRPHAAALGWTPTPWLAQQLALYASQTCRLVETAARLTVTRGNSLVASASPFHIELDTRDPVTCVPVDHLPFAPTRRHLLLAHRAWRETASGTLVVRTMRWPTEAECRLARDATGETIAGRRELLRTRVTTYVALASSTRLRVRFVLEGSVATDAKLCAMAFAPPNDADMAAYFDAPAAWETLTQATLAYERA